MIIVADTHFHLYPCYDIESAFKSAADNLASLSFAAGVGDRKILMVVFAERSDCRYFRDIAEGRMSLPGARFETRSDKTGDYAVLSKDGTPELHILPGRQTATAEGIEVLSLTSDRAIPDGLPAEDAIKSSMDAGAVPVLSWAPGKWFFERGKTVQSLIDGNLAEHIAVGDTALRPVFWPEPALLRRARERGIPVIAGSDPLPLSWEESLAGRYACAFQSSNDPAQPLATFREALNQRKEFPEIIGRRRGTLSALAGIVRHSIAKRNTGKDDRSGRQRHADNP